MNVCRLIPTDQCHYLKVANPISRIECDSQKAARQTITQEELALFDASARSWLSSADEVKISEQKRLISAPHRPYNRPGLGWPGTRPGASRGLGGLGWRSLTLM